MAKLETTLFTVTVFPDRARVTRRGKIALETGTHSIEIPDLPIQLNPDSARASARGAARARLLGLQMERLYFAETPAEQVREMEMQLEALLDEMAGLDAQAELLKTNRARVSELLGHTLVFATALAAGEMTLEAQQTLFAGLHKQAGELDTQALSVAVQKRTLERRIQQVKKQLEQARNARGRERYAAFIEVEVISAGSLTIELTYVTAGAGWKPLYDLRLLEEAPTPTLEVGYLAQVSQQTGEDWQSVELILSTARPALAATLPELDPWYIQPRPPIAKHAQAAKPMAMAARAAPVPEAPQEAFTLGAELEAEEMTASVSTSGAAVTYQLLVPASIPGDGAPHKVTVARYSLPPQLDYVTAPRLAEAAYRRAKVRNDSPYTLLPGSANLFAGEEFIGATQLEMTAPQGEIELYLGADDRVKVERELKRREVEKTIIGGKRRIHYGYEIRLENLLPVAVALTVHDQMPVPRHEEIKVRLESAEPRPSKQTELNLLDWELSLQAKEKRALRFDFLIEYPQDMEVIGLPA
jgi:uncharacterized protein (TIGR02231 family)